MVSMGATGAVQLQENEVPLARLGRYLRGLGGGGERGDHVELAASSDLRASRDVDRAQLDRRPRERPHDRAGIGRIGEQAAARRARRGSRPAGRTRPRRRAGGRSRAPRARPRPLGPRRVISGTSTAIRPACTSSRASSRSMSTATAWACERSPSQRQSSTWPAAATAVGAGWPPTPAALSAARAAVQTRSGHAWLGPSSTTRAPGCSKLANRSAPAPRKRRSAPWGSPAAVISGWPTSSASRAAARSSSWASSISRCSKRRARSGCLRASEIASTIRSPWSRAPYSAQHPLVRAIDPGELALERGLGRLGRQ